MSALPLIMSGLPPKADVHVTLTGLPLLTQSGSRAGQLLPVKGNHVDDHALVGVNCEADLVARLDVLK